MNDLQKSLNDLQDFIKSLLEGKPTKTGEYDNSLMFKNLSFLR